MSSPVPPWTTLPDDLVAGLRPHLHEVVEAVIQALPREVPQFARPLEGAFGEGVRQGVEVALGRFLDLPGTAEPALRGDDRRVYVDLGRGELRQGREMETLLAAYRVGARVAFRQFATWARAEGADADVLIPLAEAVFAYIDELSAASVEGYAHEQSLRAGESGRRRSTLLELLLAPTADPVAVGEAARSAGYLLPDSVVAVTLASALADGLAGVLGDEALIGSFEDLAVAVLPAGDRARLDRQLVGRGAAVGPARPWAGALSSARLAALGSELLRDGVLTGDPVHVQDHLTELVLHRDPELVRALAESVLHPLAELKEATRLRLTETLLAWLRHRGERQHVAAELHVHPQTVGYRLGQLRALLGAAMDTPDGRFALELALRAG